MTPLMTTGVRGTGGKSSRWVSTLIGNVTFFLMSPFHRPPPSSSLHSPTDPSQSDADCAESDGVHKDFVESKWTPHDFGCLCGLHTKIALSKDWTRLSTAEPIVTASCALYHCTIVAMYGLLTSAICVTCGLIGKHIYFYSIWDMWYGHVIYVLDQFFDGNSMAVSILGSD